MLPTTLLQILEELMADEFDFSFVFVANCFVLCLLIFATVRQRERANDARAQANRIHAESKLKSLALHTEHYIYTFERAQFTIAVPSHIDVSDITPEVEALVENLNIQKEIIECRHAIEVPNSAHSLWRSILHLIAQKYAKKMDSTAKKDIHTHASSSLPVRVLYEQRIPYQEDGIVLDLESHFVFLPPHAPCVYWNHLRGGLQLTETEKDRGSDINSDSDTPINSLYSRCRTPVVRRGKLQAIQRAALCALVRWRAEQYVGTCAAFCCYADGRRFGVVRVVVTESYEIRVEESPLWALPGSRGGNDEPLRVLAFLLHSFAEELDFACLHSISTTKSTPPAVLCAEGWDVNKSRRIQWSLSSLIGSGAFAHVFAEAPPSKCVIKQEKVNADGDSLQNEYEVLQKLFGDSSTAVSPSLSSPLHCFPVLEDTMFCEEGYVKALRFKHRGIPLNKYLINIAGAKEKMEAVVNVVGPALVRALQIAHSRGVSHNDVRAANVLLIPRDAVLDSILAWNEDIVASDDPTPLNNLDLRDAELRIVLNDWGQATPSNEGKNTSVKDLLAVVAMINAFSLKEDLGFIISYFLGNNKEINDEGVWMSHWEIIKRISKHARALEYEQLSELLSSVHLVESEFNGASFSSLLN